jgi:hypothetical protein
MGESLVSDEYPTLGREMREEIERRYVEPYREVTLEIQQFAVSRILKRIEELGGPVPNMNEALIYKLNQELDPLARQWAASFKGFFPAEEVAKYTRPVTLWDYLKERWAPRWFTTRWPIHYKEIKVTGVITNLAIPRGWGTKIKLAYFPETRECQHKP